MWNISSFLEKFSKSLQSTESEKQHILDVIEKQTNIRLNLKDFEIKNYTVEVRATPAIKNKLFIYKRQLLEEINTFSSVKVVDIK